MVHGRIRSCSPNDAKPRRFTNYVSPFIFARSSAFCLRSARMMPRATARSTPRMRLECVKCAAREGCGKESISFRQNLYASSAGNRDTCLPRDDSNLCLFSEIYKVGPCTRPQAKSEAEAEFSQARATLPSSKEARTNIGANSSVSRPKRARRSRRRGRPPKLRFSRSRRR